MSVEHIRIRVEAGTTDYARLTVESTADHAFTVRALRFAAESYAASAVEGVGPAVTESGHPVMIEDRWGS